MSLKLLSPDQIFVGGSGATFTLKVSRGMKVLVKSIEGSALKASKLNLQYEWLAQRQNLPHIAKVSHLSRDEETCSYSLRFYENYETLDALSKTASPDQFSSVILKLLTFMNEDVYWDKTSVNSPDLFHHYINDKLLKKVLDCAKSSPLLRECLSFEEIIINGESFKNFYHCFETLLKSKLSLEMNREFIQCHVHGDLTFENILVNPKTNDFILIDPNIGNDISSPIIDYAKLMQSGVSKYERMKDLSTVEFTGNHLNFLTEDLAQDEASDILLRHLDLYLSDHDKVNILLHEAIHFSRMLPYRQELNPETFPLFYGRLIQLLNRYLDQLKLS